MERFKDTHYNLQDKFLVAKKSFTAVDIRINEHLAVLEAPSCSEVAGGVDMAVKKLQDPRLI